MLSEHLANQRDARRADALDLQKVRVGPKFGLSEVRHAIVDQRPPGMPALVGVRGAHGLPEVLIVRALRGFPDQATETHLASRMAAVHLAVLESERTVDPRALTIVVAEAAGAVVCAAWIRFEQDTEWRPLGRRDPDGVAQARDLSR